MPEVVHGQVTGLINLGSLQSPDFWRAHFERAPDEFAITALAGLLATSWTAGIEFLPRLDGAEALAFAAATLIEQKLEDVPPPERDRCRRELSIVLASCSAPLKKAVGDVIGVREQAGGSNPPHSAPRRRSPLLAAACLNLGIRDSERQRCARLAWPLKDAA